MTHNSIKAAAMFLLIASFICTGSYAQDKENNVTRVAASQKCKDLPLNQRIRMRVDRFNVTTDKAGDADFGANMATHLTDALQNVNCFKMLETLNNLDDSKREQDFGNSSNTTGKSSPKAGKMQGAQIVATGEITEYNISDNGKHIMMVNTSSKTVTIGFTIKLVDPETHSIIDSKAFKVTGSAGHHTTIYGQGGGTKNDPAAEDALQNAVNEAAEYIAGDLDRIHDALNSNSASTSAEGITTVITISNSNFSKLNDFVKNIKSDPNVKDETHSLNGGMATVTVTYAKTSTDLATYIDGKMGSKYEVVTVNDGTIELRQK